MARIVWFGEPNQQILRFGITKTHESAENFLPSWAVGCEYDTFVFELFDSWHAESMRENVFRHGIKFGMAKKRRGLIKELEDSASGDRVTVAATESDGSDSRPLGPDDS